MLPFCGKIELMKNHKPQRYYNTYQLKLPLEIERIIEISDPVYTFCEVMDHIDLYKYLAVEESKTGRPKYDRIALLKVVLFAFMEEGYVSVRKIEKLCKTDIRFMWLLRETFTPSFMTIDNFMKEELKDNIKNIFEEINSYIFNSEHVDTNHVYIDGTKITANANKYSWVWKKSCLRNRDKTFAKISSLLEEMNVSLQGCGVKLGLRKEYAIEYLEEILAKYADLMNLHPETAIRGRGHRKSVEQRQYDALLIYTNSLKKYAEHIRICGEERNSYAKTDHDATFMRMKRDYMGNGQLLPGYNIQLGLCDEYIAVYDVKRYASDMDCFQPLMQRFNDIYGKYPEYPVADAGYGSYDNYLFCEEHGMKKYMKFTMFRKETEDAKYREDPYRAVNFKRNEKGEMICPGGKRFHYWKTRPVKGNHYGRTEELYQCEDCSGCPNRSKCTKGEGNRTIRINEELTAFHSEVLANLNCVHGALLRMNRSIQAEGAYGGIKWNRAYTRARRRGIDGLIFEISLISCGFNLHKLYLKRQASAMIA